MIFQINSKQFESNASCIWSVIVFVVFFLSSVLLSFIDMLSLNTIVQQWIEFHIVCCYWQVQKRRNNNFNSFVVSSHEHIHLAYSSEIGQQLSRAKSRTPAHPCCLIIVIQHIISFRQVSSLSAISSARMWTILL